MKAIILSLKMNMTKMKFRSNNTFLVLRIQIQSKTKEECISLTVCFILKNTHKIQPFDETQKRKPIIKNQQRWIPNYILG
jgi:hypothetical protein